MPDVKILLVEEDALEASDIKKTLESFGYSVPYVVNNLHDALQKTYDLHFNLFLIDLSPQGESGGIQVEDFEAINEIKKLEIPILYLTVNLKDVKIQKGSITEQEDYLIKPYDASELKIAIELAIYKAQIKKELKASENYYRTIFEHTGTATVIIEEDTTISLANTEFERLSGYLREEIEGKKSWTEFTYKEDLEKMKEYHYLRRVNPNSAPLIYDFRFIDREGNVKHIHLDIGMIPGTKKSVASLLDITDRVKRQEELQFQNVLLEEKIKKEQRRLGFSGND